MKKAVSALITIVLAAFFLTACGAHEVEEISVYENSVKTVYAVDEGFPKGAKLAVKYKNGKTETVSIDFSNGVSGFDTSTSGVKTMTIGYGGKSVDVEYTVAGRVNVKARVDARAKFLSDGVRIILSLGGLDTLGSPLYAIRITVGFEAEKLGDVSARALADGWTRNAVNNEGSVSFLFYDETSENPISSEGAFAEIDLKWVAEPASSAEFTFSGGTDKTAEIEASDGEELWFLPAFGMGYSIEED